MGLDIAGIPIPSRSPLFLTLLAVHVPVGLLAVASGLGAMLAQKKRGVHTTFGLIYFWSLGVLCATSAMLSVVRWSQDYHLFFLGMLAFIAAVVGRETRRRRWLTAPDLHIAGMGLSYITMLTAFYVDNGKNLPIWRDLPSIAYWTVPGAVGLPLMIRALFRRQRA
jgi:hypothetical protein